MQMTFRTGLLALAMAMAMTTGGIATAAEHEAETIAAGRLLYEETAGGTGCVACHGADATGNPDIGAPFIQGVSMAQMNAALDGGVPDMDYFGLGTRDKRALYEFLQYMAHAEDVALSPEAEAGRKIFEETAGGVGCQSCHGVGARGDTAPDIRGRNARDILQQLRQNENMQFIKLSKTEIAQVAAYLDYLHTLEGH